MLNLYNTLSKKKEEFKSIKFNFVGLYTCGPTVYDYAHIGNLRTYIFEDILKRVLLYNNYKVKHIMNITDVGHLTDDADDGEDKMEKGSKREGKSAWDIAEYYTKAFKKDLKSLNILSPVKYTKATDYIPEQIDLIKKLEKNGFTYKISDGIYFDTSKFPNYNKLSHLKLEELQEGARVEINKEKKNATDFAVWKFSGDEKRQMEWKSPWGIGFPGWHLECSAMSITELRTNLDIHCGGIDHINVHHTNEIAQSEAAYPNQKFFNYWMHGAFLNISGGKKMAKSGDNFLTIENAFLKKNINPLVYRFACLQTNYRKPMEYSEDAIINAQKGYNHLKNQVEKIVLDCGDLEYSINNYTDLYNIYDNIKINNKFKNKFLAVINDDLNTPQALAVLQELLKSNLDDKEKLATIFNFDKIFGLGLGIIEKKESLPDEIQELVELRKKARNEKNWEESDRLRNKIKKNGYVVEDVKNKMKIYKE